MTGGNILPSSLVLMSGKALSVCAQALHRVKARLRLSERDVADLAGKSDRKSGKAYLAADSDMGLCGFIRFAAAIGELEGPVAKAAFVSDVLRPLVGLLATPVQDAGKIDMDALQLALAHLNLSALRAWNDRKLDHNEVLTLADDARALLPMLGAIMAEADRIRGN